MIFKFLSAASASPTLQRLSNELNSVENWHLLGVKLGLQGSELREIERNYPRDSSRCKTEVLDLFLRSAVKPTWESIVDALCLMNEHVVADGIRNKYCSTSIVIGIYLVPKGQNGG